MSFEAGGRTFTGCTVESFGVTARGLGANAVGINCLLGPKEIFPMAKRLAEAVPGDFPVFVKPNAGLPWPTAAATISPAALRHGNEALPGAASVCGGRLLRHHAGVHQAAEQCFCRLGVPGRPAHKMPSVLCTPVDFVNVDGITVVGERINPTGKSASSRHCGKRI